MNEYFGLLIIPLLIFLSRTVDVSLGTIRLIFVSRGIKSVAPIIGFFEVLIWLAAMQQILTNLTNFWYYIVYALGFSFGTFVGMKIDEKLSVGNVLVRIILSKKSSKLSNELNNQKISFTMYNGEGGKSHKSVESYLIVIQKRKLNCLLKIISNVEPDSFYIIEELRAVHSSNVGTKKIGFGSLRKAK